VVYPIKTVKMRYLSITEILKFDNNKMFSEEKMKLIAILIIVLSLYTTTDTFANKYYPNFVGNRWVLRNMVNPDFENVVEISGKEFIAGQKVNVLHRHTHKGTDKLYIT